MFCAPVTAVVGIHPLKLCIYDTAVHSAAIGSFEQRCFQFAKTCSITREFCGLLRAIEVLLTSVGDWEGWKF